MAEAADYQGRKRALVISISQYDKLAALDFCEKDGNKIYGVLSQLGYEIPDKHKLIGGRVEYDKLRDSIYHFFYDKTIDPKDTVLFYFSGHGIVGDDGEHYLSTSEIDSDLPRLRGFPFDDLTKAREGCNSKMIFTILDCCYSGADKPGAKGQEESANAAKDTIKDKSNISGGEGKCILAACKPMQKAFEYKEKGHSFFSYYLAEALANQTCADENGDITPYMLNTYIDNKIRSLPAEIRPKQTPLLNCSTSGNIVLAHYPKKVPSIALEWKGSKSDYLLKLLQEEKIEEFNKIRKEGGDVPLYLRRIDLRGKKLNGVDLHEADLTETKLIGAKLTTANLNSAKLKGADLSGADLRSADLYGASLSEANLTRADLRGADLKGMIDFSGANLTGADIRGVDLTGMVNFAGAKLHDVDFTGSATDKGLINFVGADIRNAKGLPVLHEPNEYLEELKSFSESIKQQFKTYNISAEEVKSIEETVKELVEEVKDIEKPEEIDGIKKKNINLKFVDMAKGIIKALPTKKAETLRVFTPLMPFAKIIGQEVPQIVDSIQKNISGTTTHIEDQVERPSTQEVKTTGSPFYQDKTTYAEKESTIEPIIKKPAFEANPPPVTPKAYPAEDKKSTGYQYKAEKKSSLNKWIIILPIILVAAIGIVVAISFQHPAPTPPPAPPIQPTQQSTGNLTSAAGSGSMNATAGGGNMTAGSPMNATAGGGNMTAGSPMNATAGGGY